MAVHPRRAGVLCHVTSIPGGGPAGDLGVGARRWLDWLQASGHRVWQVLPLQPVDAFGSPYASTSSIACEPLLLSLDDLHADGFLPAPVRLPHAPRVDFDVLRAQKAPHLARAAEAIRVSVDVEAWAEGIPGLRDVARYDALAAHYGRSWTSWPAALRDRDPDALDRADAAYAESIGNTLALQWAFHRQWGRLRADAASRGIELWGDMPFFVGRDSADVWCAPHRWRLDADGEPLAVSGYPPDPLHPRGQLWGHPVYDEAAHADEGYAWWLDRLGATLRLVDRVRLDHFLGVAAYWANPGSAVDGRDGTWVDGPGAALLAAIVGRWPEVPLVAEDLGYVTAKAAALRDEHGVPGMNVVLFGFIHALSALLDGDNPHVPYRHRPGFVAYSGTHDTDTLVGLVASLDTLDRHHMRVYFGCDDHELPWALLRSCWQSPCHVAVAQVQDLFQLGPDARMNTPGTVQRANWSWRAPDALLTGERAATFREHLRVAGRVGA